MKKSHWSSQLHSQETEEKTIHFYNPERDIEEYTLENRNLFTEYDTDDEIPMRKEKKKQSKDVIIDFTYKSKS